MAESTLTRTRFARAAISMIKSKRKLDINIKQYNNEEGSYRYD